MIYKTKIIQMRLFQNASVVEFVEALVERGSVVADVEASTASYNGGFDKLNHRLR